MAGDTKQITEAVDKLDGVVKDLVAHFESVPDVPAAPGAPWGSREVLAHMVFWHEFTCQAFEEVSVGRTMPYPKENVDDINARVIQLVADRPIRELSKDLLRDHARLRETASTLKDPDAVAIIRPDGTTMTVAGRLERMAQHYGEHLADLKKAKK